MIWIIVACAALSIGVCLPLFLRYKVIRPGWSLVYKALGTACALIPAISGAVPLGESAWFCVAALILCVMGDVFIDMHFFLGAGFFLLGHICYIAWFYSCIGLTSTLAVVLASLLAAGAGILWIFREEIGKKQLLPFVVYLLFLSGSTSFAISFGLSAARLDGLLSLSGGILFFVSDLMLFYRTLRPAPKWFGGALMVLYYAAQVLLGSGCMARAML